jgi:hypothetical protein
MGDAEKSNNHWRKAEGVANPPEIRIFQRPNEMIFPLESFPNSSSKRSGD